MYYRDGYVYGGEPKGIISVIRVKPLNDMMMILLYYVHVLGDHMDEHDYNKRKSCLIEAGGTHDNKTNRFYEQRIM